MGITYKFVLDKRRKKADRTYPLKLRIFQNGIFKEKAIDILIHEDAWQEKQQSISISDIRDKQYNYALNNLKVKIDKLLLLSEDSNDDLTPIDVLNKLFNDKASPNVSFKHYSETLIKRLNSANRVGTALAYKDATNSLLNYGGENLSFKDISYQFLENYNSIMRSKGVKINAIAAYLRSIRAIYNKAINEEVATTYHYPFKKFKIETEDTISRTLTIKELQNIVGLNLESGSRAWHHRNYFLLSFYLIGINYTDMFTLRADNLVNDTITYRRSKTGKLYKIVLAKPAKELFEYYSMSRSNNNHIYLLPELKITDNNIQRKKWMKQVVKNNNKCLSRICNKCSINKKVTTYFARYTWANLAKQLGYSKDMIAEALGHEYGNKVTGIYLDKYDAEIINKMNINVINSILNNLVE